MNKLTKNELLDLILYTIKAKKKIVDDVDDDDDDDSFFNLQKNLKLVKPEAKKKNVDDDMDYMTGWFGSGHSKIQSVIIPKKKFTRSQAIDYVKKHFKYKKIDEKRNYYRFRQFNPKKNSHYSSKKLKNGVILVIEYDKESGGSLSVENFKEFITNSYNPDKHHIGDFEIDKELSDNEVQVFKNQEKHHLVIVFRGTEGTFRDWGNNAHYLIGFYKNTRRFKNSERVFNEALEKYPDYKITLVGHSQGFVPEHILNNNRVYEALALNPAWTTEKQKNNEYIVRSSIDGVSMLVPKNKNNIILPAKTYNPLYEHSTKILDSLNPNDLIGKQN